MNMLIFAITGLVIGVVARLLLPGHDGYGIIGTSLVGMAGGWLGGFLGGKLGIAGAGQMRGILLSVAGAMLLLLILRNV